MLRRAETRPVPSPLQQGLELPPPAICLFPSLLLGQVQVGFPVCLPLCYMGITLKTEAVLCRLQLSAPIIASTHGLLSNPHKAPQAVLGAVWLLEMGIHTVLLNANDCMRCWGQNMSERGLIHGEVLVGRHLSSGGKAQPEGTERSV